MVKQRGERIGLIGLTTPALRSVSSPRDVEIDDELARVTNEHVAALQRQRIDKIILLSHLQDIDNERALVAELDGVDAVVGGGGGELLAGEDDPLVPGDTPDEEYPIVAADRDGTRVPIVTTPGEYEYVGRLVLHFEDGEVVGWDDGASGPVRVSGVEPDAVAPDPVVTQQVVEPVEAFVAELDETVVATSEVSLNGVRNAVRTRETNLGNVLGDALRWEGEQQAGEFGLPPPRVAIQNGGGIRNDSTIPAGEVTALDTFDVAPFANFVAVLPEVPREDLKALMERGLATAPDPGVSSPRCRDCGSATTRRAPRSRSMTASARSPRPASACGTWSSTTAPSSSRTAWSSTARRSRWRRTTSPPAAATATRSPTWTSPRSARHTSRP